jgi:hypothetical protein
MWVSGVSGLIYGVVTGMPCLSNGPSLAAGERYIERLSDVAGGVLIPFLDSISVRGSWMKMEQLRLQLKRVLFSMKKNSLGWKGREPQAVQSLQRGLSLSVISQSPA